MSILLPEPLVWVMDVVLGLDWPEGDEDQCRAHAAAWRTFGRQVRDVRDHTNQAMLEVRNTNSGTPIDRLDEIRRKVADPDGGLQAIEEIAGHMAEGLEQLAVVLVETKVLVIAELEVLAALLVADQAAAPETLGASEAAAAGEVAASRAVVSRLLSQGAERVGQIVAAVLKGNAESTLVKLVANLGQQIIQSPVTGWDPKRIGDLTSQGVELVSAVSEGRKPHAAGAEGAGHEAAEGMPGHGPKAAARSD